MSRKGNDCWQTPPSLFKQLNDIFNFTIDVACDSDNCLIDLPAFQGGFRIDRGLDGLRENWSCFRCFCNPPFSDKAKWIEKAYNEVINGECPICVMILPTNCIDTKAWHKYIEGKVHYEILEGRVSFIDPNTGKPESGNNSGTAIVYFKKRITR